jgi:hypothetical protein
MTAVALTIQGCEEMTPRSKTSTIVTLVLFLIGSGSLLAQDEPARPPRSLEEKMQRFQPHAERWHRVSLIMKDFQPLIERGEFERAEKLLDRALSLLDAKSGEPRDLEHLNRFRRVTDETHYLILPVKEAGHLYSGRTAQFEKAVEAIEQRLGAAADPTKCNWGFHLIIPAWRLDPAHPFHENASPQTLAQAVKAAFDVALRQDVAVYFTVENLEWANRPDLWNYSNPDAPGHDPDNVQNVEWLDWDGTPHPHRYRDWGTPEKMPPVICYNSPEVLQEVSRLAKDVIGPEIAAGLDRLAKAGKLHLLAGVTVGAEPSLPNYDDIEKFNPRIARMMERDGVPRSRLGYNALTNLGFSEKKPPEDFAAALAKVNQDYSAYWARKLGEGGVPQEKMYTHVAAGAGVVGSPGVKYTNAPISIAFIDSARPGWTTYPVGPLQDDFQTLYEQLAAHGNPPWASTEASPRGLGHGGLSMREYLGWHFDFGATVVLFNTGATSPDLSARLDDAVWGDEAIQAYRNFLGPQL